MVDDAASFWSLHTVAWTLGATAWTWLASIPTRIALDRFSAWGLRRGWGMWPFAAAMGGAMALSILMISCLDLP